MEKTRLKNKGLYNHLHLIFIPHSWDWRHTAFLIQDSMTQAHSWAQSQLSLAQPAYIGLLTLTLPLSLNISVISLSHSDAPQLRSPAPIHVKFPAFICGGLQGLSFYSMKTFYSSISPWISVNSLKTPEIYWQMIKSSKKAIFMSLNIERKQNEGELRSENGTNHYNKVKSVEDEYAKI